MKILNKEDVGKYTLYTLLLDNNTTTTVSVVNDTRDEKEIMKDIRILTKDTVGEPFVGNTVIEDYVFEDSKPTLMYVDFNNLTGEVYDQYADVVDMKIAFTVEGTDKARIENGRLIEDTVEEDVSYFIVAKAGDIVEKQERTIYAPVVPQPNELDLLKAKLEEEQMNSAMLTAELTNMIATQDRKIDEAVVELTTMLANVTSQTL